MYLKRLEVHGFKSFADKIGLDFCQSLSVVVGPNGSGKSNIADAIRWVIGEQSAKSLRGAKMEDVIFAGTAKRRPVGMAEVSLTLDNSAGVFPLDFNEITVTRRIYRSGETEYFINKSSCRLKDVHELFMDTGIGRDGFSIISQGKVEEILSSKPEERRGLVEEVAGITKYRHRKREATRKLDETELNLVRIADIIGELEVQIEPLREQAAKAKQYQGIKQELDQLELNLAVHDVQDLSSKLETCRGQIAQIQDSVVTREANSGVLEAEIAEAKFLLQSLDEQIYTSQNNCHAFSTQIQKLQSEINLCDERTTTLGQQQKRIIEEDTELKRKLDNLRSEFGSEEAKVLILRQTRKELEEKLASAEARLTEYNLELGNAEGRVEDLKAEAFEVLARSAKINNEITAVVQQAESYHNRQTGLEHSKRDKVRELEELEQRVQTLDGDLSNLAANLTDLTVELEGLRASEGDIRQKYQQSLVQSNKLKETLQSCFSRLRVLKDMQREFEGYNRGVREVLLAAQKGKLQGISGVVAELLEVPSRLETAIEVALGGSLQNVVTLTEQGAKAAVTYLKNTKSGRATFLPLDVLKPTGGNFEPKVLKVPGVLGVASDLIQCEEKFRSVADYLLGRILVVENLNQASEVARLGGYRLRIVTLDGELLNPGGSMTGGSLQQRSSSLLGRNREITRLEEEEIALRQKLLDLQEEEERFQLTLEELGKQSARVQAGIKELELSRASYETRRANLNIEDERIRRELSLVEEQLQQVAGELDRLGVRHSELEETKLSCQREYDVVNAKLAGVQEDMKGQGTAREQLQAGILELKVKTASLEQEEKGIDAALKRYYQQKAEFEDALGQKRLESAELERRKEEIEREKSALLVKLEELVQAERAGQWELNSLREQRLEKMESLDTKSEREKNLRKQLEESREQLHTAQVREARLDTEINTALNRMQEHLGLSFSEAAELSSPLNNRRETVMRVNKLKGEITGLGTVSLGAIEEYERVHERFEFLSSQRSDLEQAKASLFNVIAEMDRIMTERFDKAFTSINQRFVEVFADLFGGGRAQLQLTDPDNLLETGIEISAQPPGKKLQHLSLLSGGEKALTAIALLFAMLQVKPSPFCILDEIEAALDEANVNRFADYLRELSGANQFIVISHRKGTMEAADALYGVTMEESGVSKLYSVRLADSEEHETLVGK